ncbi:unnamed protein product [Zymoseptoria tritici ST99CH_3D1]|nr:unnamed protein product [Zymoseptoria tritici ST99CH_3D1]
MQTRRKSLNLGDMGVIAPKRHLVSTTHSVAEEHDEHRPAKKTKWSHLAHSPASGLMSPPRTTTVIRIKEEKEKPKMLSELSPPPSPVLENGHKVDTEGIHDDIVVGAIQQLEKTGNRPHLVKELAAVLATKLHSVEKSANPTALISSRLTAYLHRSWPAISPCPLAKDLSPIHPRRLYFYLTTTPHQPIPEVVASEPPKPARIISPSLSSASAADEEDGPDQRNFIRDRHALSPSPEVDLSSHDLDSTDADDGHFSPPAPVGSYPSRDSISREQSDYSHSRRAASPPLENEERDFKQTASALYEQALARRSSQESARDVSMDGGQTDTGAEQDADSISMSIEGLEDEAEETEESAAQKNSECAAALFSSEAGFLNVKATTGMDFSSPVLRPRSEEGSQRDGKMEVDVGEREVEGMLMLPDAAMGGWDLGRPEEVELEELEDMFDAY